MGPAAHRPHHAQGQRWARRAAALFISVRLEGTWELGVLIATGPEGTKEPGLLTAPGPSGTEGNGLLTVPGSRGQESLVSS